MTFAEPLRRNLTRLRAQLRELWQPVAALPVRTRRAIEILTIVVAVFGVLKAGNALFRSGSNLAEGPPPIDVIQQAQNRVVAIRAALEQGRDSVANSRLVQELLAKRFNDAPLFGLLEALDSAWEFNLPDSLIRQSRDKARQADRGLAIYSSNGRLIAWTTNAPGTFNFDSILTNRTPDGKVSSFLQQDGPIYVYASSVRRILGANGAFLGYAVARRLLATKLPEAGGTSYASTLIDDLRANTRRDVQLHFNPAARALPSDETWTRATLVSDTVAKADFVARISVGEPEGGEAVGFAKIITVGFDVLLSLLILLICGVTASSLRNTYATKRPIKTRLVYSLAALLLLAICRVALSLLEGVSSVLPAAIQDPNDFASPALFGIFRSPWELFVTTVFASVGSVLLWLVWMPRRRMLRGEEDFSSDTPTTTAREALTLISYAVAAVAMGQVLLTGLESAIQAVIKNGTGHFMVVRQVIPAPGKLLVMLGLLGIGAAYIFLTTLIYAFALRAVVVILPSGITLRKRVGIGVTILMLVAAGASILAADSAGASDNYRLLLTLGMLLWTAGVMIVDAFLHHPLDDTPSFLFRMPRSNRTILFILAVSSIIVSPIVAEKEFEVDQELARHYVIETTQTDIPFLVTSVERALTAAQDFLADASTSTDPNDAIRQSAFVTWLYNLSDRPDWSASIDVLSADGTVLSHYATGETPDQAVRLRSYQDSLSKELRKIGGRRQATGASGTSPYSPTLRYVDPCFTAACTPLVMSGMVLDRKRVGDSTAKGVPRYIMASVWNDLLTTRHTFDLMRLTHGGTDAGSERYEETRFVVAQYRPYGPRLTNAPSAEVPAALPAFVERKLAEQPTLWQTTRFGGGEYRTIYRRLSGSSGRVPVVAVSVPKPSSARIAEFALRLNALGLIYGIAIALVILLVRQLVLRRLRFTLRFRDRIFLVVLAIALIPLTVVTDITRTLLTERRKVDVRDRLARDAGVISDRIGAQMESGVLNIFGLGLEHDVYELAQILGRDFSVYDNHGILRASTRPELYQSSLLASQLTPKAMSEVLFGRKQFSTEQLSIRGQAVQVGHQPILAAEGHDQLGVISVATLEELSLIEEEIARTTSFIYSTFAALGLVLLAIGALFAARVALPILSLINATKRVAEGRLGTSITVTREDEIGELMHAFNAMTAELERSREKVAQTERELAWKEMARQVAHEIKNPLTPMKLSVQHLEFAHEHKDPNFNTIFRRVIKTLSEQIDLLTRIASEFSRFGEMPRRRYGPVSVKQVAESAVALFDSERSRIRFIIDIPDGIGYIHADEQEFRRALVNLLRNAVQAIDGWGVIVLRATQDRGMVHLKISDTGSGMDDETLSRVFDPNFSTKTSGMGLGLAIVKKTITDMSGSISVESRLGHGTTFFIDVPLRQSGEVEDRR